MVTEKTRYSDLDLKEFKERIERKLGYARDDYAFVSSQIVDQTENMESDSDWMDSSSSNNDLELLYIMANRQKKHINDLEKALIRVANRTYGICEITGELIDKRRLMAVPTTAKSLAAKLGEIPVKKVEEDHEEEPKKKKPVAKSAPVIISRIIKKSSATSLVILNDDNDDDDDDDDDMEDDDLDLDFDVLNEEEIDMIDPDSLDDDNEEE